ncbi:MAG: hypothetical protein MRZ74_09750 [Blautia sp.]|nr:hypothetical protein [Blautia sp.]MDY5031201.1 hypothetical protein [Blautia sp.]
MKKDVINSMIIGLLTTYLPVFDISGAAEHMLGMLAIGIAVLAFTIWAEEKNEPQGGNP